MYPPGPSNTLSPFPPHRFLIIIIIVVVILGVCGSCTYRICPLPLILLVDSFSIFTTDSVRHLSDYMCYNCNHPPLLLPRWNGRIIDFVSRASFFLAELRLAMFSSVLSLPVHCVQVTDSSRAKAHRHMPVCVSACLWVYAMCF